MTVAASSEVFTRAHIAVTAGITGVIVLGFAWWRLDGRRVWITRLVVAGLAAAAVFLWRVSANMPQLNRDGLSGYSANDWLAPVVAYVVLSVYADLFPPENPRRFAQVRAAATVTAFVVNVITI
jgi:hypothetical protein